MRRPPFLIVFLAFALFASCRTARAERRSGELQEGMASYYGGKFHGRLTANGERFDKNELTAAHRTFKFGTCVVVENVRNRKSVRVRINDRGPYAGNRIIDVSEAAARELDMIQSGLAPVRLYPC